MNFLSLKITNQDHPSHSTDGEIEMKEKSWDQIKDQGHISVY